MYIIKRGQGVESYVTQRGVSIGVKCFASVDRAVYVFVVLTVTAGGRIS